MLQNLKIATRIAIMVAILSSIIVLNAGIYFYAINSTEKGLENIYTGGTEDMLLLVQARTALRNISQIPQKILIENTSTAEAAEIFRTNIQSFEQNWETYLKLIDPKENNEKPLELLNESKQIYKELKSALQGVEETIKNENKETLRTHFNKFRSSIDRLSSDMLNLISWHAKDTEHDYKEVLLENQRLKYFTVSLLVISLLLGLGLSLWIANSITKPLSRALNDVKRLTMGDLSIDSVDYTQDETGRLLEAMGVLATSSKKMSDILTSVSKGDLTARASQRSEQDTLGLALINMIKNLKHIIGEIQSETSTLTASSQEILESVSQVAAGSVETAAAVTETTTSMEELKQTAHVSDEKAKDVLLSAEETLQAVNASEKSLQMTIEDMNQINDKMHTISTGIVKLSENSQVIREIIDTVNDLAEQSNLLAVNAAIEAAKAGEHGKSFAVVAQEIRTLAEQSKNATVQVRSILNDIQNSTSQAVLATEQGSKAVEKGVNQSVQTSEFMKQLIHSMTRVIQAANQIVMSSQQQLIGIDQVSVAMNNINEASNQHAEHIKQIETAVISLNSVGDILKELVNSYTLSDEYQKEIPSKLTSSKL